MALEHCGKKKLKEYGVAVVVVVSKSEVGKALPAAVSLTTTLWFGCARVPDPTRVCVAVASYYTGQ